MGDFWSGTTAYDQNQGDRDRIAAKAAQDAADARSARLGTVLSDKNSPFSINGGTADEQNGRIDGLQRAKILTGQNPYEIGQDYQQAYGNIKKRTENADVGSNLLRANKAGAMADAKNGFQSAGVKGGAAVKGVAAVERAKSFDVNAQLMDNQRQAQSDYLNATKANANFTQASEMNYGSLAAGNDVKPPSQYSNGMGTVICTELFLQGHYSKEIYLADQIYGLNMEAHNPEVYWGYRAWADYVVAGMRKSKLFTRFVALLAVPWARNMAGDKNLLGATVSFIGEPICGFIGKHLISGEKYEHQKA